MERERTHVNLNIKRPRLAAHKGRILEGREGGEKKRAIDRRGARERGDRGELNAVGV